MRNGSAWALAWRAGTRAATALLDAAMPPECLTCDRRVGRQGELCAACFRATRFIAGPCCARCAVPFANRGQGGLAGLCPACRDAPPPYRRARAALVYDEQARRILLPFKHGDRTETAAALAPHMVRAGAEILADADLLVPVPLHRWRLFHRRYNQAALLCRAIARRTGLAVLPDALRRDGRRGSLHGLSAAARHGALRAAIAADPRRAVALRGRRIVLVDDVMTSGATADACARALLAAGAVRVDVLAAARVPDPRLSG